MKVLIAAVVLRVLLLCVGAVQDSWSAVKYTDVDYHVFQDAARLVAGGRSPFGRATFRYTPLLAWLLAAANGKALFCASDVAAAWSIARINGLRLRSNNNNHSLEALLWALNPFVAVISTRGNAEALIAALVLAVVLLLMRGRVAAAALLFGLAVHLKVYAVIYALPLWFYIDHGNEPVPSTVKVQSRPQSRPKISSRSRSKSRSKKSTPSKTTRKPAFRLFTWNRVSFGAISAAVFFILGFLFYYMYGYEFLEHTYLYHVTRQDHRHNFSIYFYHLYLSATGISNVSTSDISSKLSGLVAFIPQLGVSTFVGVVAAYRGDIVFALFSQTFVFVMLNKVVTSQYFMWYLCFLPIILQDSDLVHKNPKKGLFLIGLWVLGQAVWLLNAYRLEHLGENTFRALHFAGIFFQLVNSYILVEITRAHKPQTITSTVDSIPRTKKE
ncbi:GPI mannosyltransferase 1-like protein [Obelidium mucronatum]|nr:GPI mannosyltransferase 1-like protein [Obelidium mucronatum]